MMSFVNLPNSADSLGLVLGALLLGFIPGAIPFGYIAGRMQGIDMRLVGSGNIGFTNVARVLGWRYALPVLALDFAKGLVPAVIAGRLMNVLMGSGGSMIPILGSDSVGLQMLVGLGAILGHVFTPVLRFRGGKGVATTAGVVAAIAPLAFAFCCCLFLVVLALFRYLSLASVVAVIGLPAVVLLFYPGRPIGLVLFCSLIALVVVIRHRSNLRRLLSGTETKFRFSGRSGSSV
ncbi:MAG: glycerol-3-phosphate 1-O-acyltransferase PlsY [candidate division WOR-3 bacterium]